MSADRTADAILADLLALGAANTSQVRTLRRRWTRALRDRTGTEVLAIALDLLERHGQRFVAYELLRYHPAALALVNAAAAERLAAAPRTWWEVDMFGCLIGGQVWRRGQIEDEIVYAWARRTDRWWRRAALVCTVPLNVRAEGGTGDAPRTLAVCRLLVDDRDDMVVKALSWALRALVPHDPTSVQAFLEAHGARLAARVQREVRNKLRTGLKTPRRVSD